MQNELLPKFFCAGMPVPKADKYHSSGYRFPIILLDNRDLNATTLARPYRSDGPARSVQAGVEIKLEFPFNASWACPEVVYLWF